MTTGGFCTQPILSTNINKSKNCPFYIYYQNVRGLNTKTQVILNSTYTCHYDAIALTETWLDDRTNNAEIISNNFNVFRSDRNFIATDTKRGGGVLIALNKKISMY